MWPGSPNRPSPQRRQTGISDDDHSTSPEDCNPLLRKVQQWMHPVLWIAVPGWLALSRNALSPLSSGISVIWHHARKKPKISKDRLFFVGYRYFSVYQIPKSVRCRLKKIPRYRFGFSVTDPWLVRGRPSYRYYGTHNGNLTQAVQNPQWPLTLVDL